MRRALVLTAVAAGLAACGLSVMGVGTLSEASEAGVPDDVAVVDVASPVDAGPDVVIDAGCEPDDSLKCCGGAVCPEGTTSCMDGRCYATLTVAANIDGLTDLVLQSGKVWWFLATNKPPTSTTLDGTGYAPSFPSYNGDDDDNCECASVKVATLTPPAATHTQHAVVTKTTGRGTVGLVDAGSATNQYQLWIDFDDPASNSANYGATIEYETR